MSFLISKAAAKGLGRLPLTGGMPSWVSISLGPSGDCRLGIKKVMALVTGILRCQQGILTKKTGHPKWSASLVTEKRVSMWETSFCFLTHKSGLSEVKN